MSEFAETAESRKPVRGSAIRILHLTDFHFRSQAGLRMLGMDTEQSFAGVLAAALASEPQPDLLLATGDLAQDCEASAYRRLKTYLADLPFPCYCLPGNHDESRLIAENLVDGSIGFQPQILLDGWQLICLDSSLPRTATGHLADAQLELLQTLLDRHPERHALIALHHHPRPTGSAWMDTMVLANADRFFAILEARPQVHGVVFGHIHQDLDIEFQGLRLLGTPSTCFQFQPRQADFALDPLPPGYRWIELQADGGIASRVERLAELPEGLDIGSHGY